MSSRFFRGEYSSSDSDEDDYSSDSSSSGSELNFVPKKIAEKTSKQNAPASDSEDSLFEKDSDSSESETEMVKGLTGRNKWLKKSILLERFGLVLDDDEPVQKVDTKRKQKQRQKKIVEEDDDVVVPIKVVQKSVDLTLESIYKQLNTIMEARGRKGTDKQAQVDSLRAIYDQLAKTPYQKVRSLLALLPAQFDLASASFFIGGSLWKNVASDVKDLLEIIEKNRNIVITDTINEMDNDEDNEQKLKNGETVSLLGNIGSYLDRLDQEFLKSLQFTDPHSPEYIERLQTETELYTLFLRAQHYFGEIESRDALALVIMCRIEHMYYKPQYLIQAIHDQIKLEYPFLATLLDISDTIDHLTTILSQVPHEKLRMRSLLCNAYHQALHDKYDQAAQVLNSSLVQEFIENGDNQTVCLYNRATVQLSLSAFRAGMVKESADALHELFSSGKIKELLAQGSQQREKEEKTERTRQLPFHMHINLELIECVYLTSCMLLEIPAMAQYKHEYRKKVVSKQFKRLMDFHERQAFVGPPENQRDLIVAASRSILESNWKEALKSILSISAWNKIPNAQEMLTTKIKQECLKTFLYSSIHLYTSLDIKYLSECFELSSEAVKELAKTVSLVKQTGNYFVLAEQEKSKLESLVNGFSEKLSILVENNEKMADCKSEVKKRKQIK